jgi:signal transduction histidine kinase/ActR/RegA family two-component response regulator
VNPAIEERSTPGAAAQADIPVPDAELYALVADGAPWGFVLTGIDGRLLATGCALGELFGLGSEELLGIRALGATEAAHAALVQALAARTLHPAAFTCARAETIDAPSQDEIALLDGRVLERQAFPARDRAGQVAGYVAYFRDISRRRRAEEDVLDRERQMRAVFDSALDAMLIVDDAGVIRDANSAAGTLLGGGRSQVIGRGMTEIVPAMRGRRAEGEDPGVRLTALTRARGRMTGETEVGLPGHRPRSVEFAAVPNILPGRHLGVMRDVTERKQLHARLALADRMVSVGTLAAGVGHELNNPLAYVNANLGFLSERLGRVAEVMSGAAFPGPADAELARELQEAVRDARNGTERMRIIIRDLKTFSRMDEDKAEPVDLRPVLESCVNMAWNEIRHRARLVKDLGPVPPVRGNEARLGQVFLNLLVNAAQAIPEGQVAGNEIRIVTRREAGGRVAVEVRDTGCGIPPEHLSRVFDPFFTTKPPGVGTGLGLAICHSIVARLGGEIAIESRVPGGTTVRVVLDAAVPAVAPGAPAPLRAPVRPRGKILVVDDEPLVGTVIQRALQAEHEIAAVTSARAALARLDAGETFDLVLSDLLMPEMSGMELHGEISRRDPALARRMVFLTGGAFTPSAREFLERESVRCVEKPFELEPFRALLARWLAEGARR